MLTVLHSHIIIWVGKQLKCRSELMTFSVTLKCQSFQCSKIKGLNPFLTLYWNFGLICWSLVIFLSNKRTFWPIPFSSLLGGCFSLYLSFYFSCSGILFLWVFAEVLPLPLFLGYSYRQVSCKFRLWYLELAGYLLMKRLQGTEYSYSYS